MSKIESKVGQVSIPDSKLYTFLSDFNNFGSFVPPDKVKNWKSTSDTCSFYVDGIGEAGLRIIEKQPFHTIKVSSDGSTPFNFTLWIQIKKVEENDSRIRLVIEPSVSQLVFYMIQSPLQNFADLLVEQIEKINLP